MSFCIILGFTEMESKFGALANHEGSQDRWLLEGFISSEQAHVGFEMWCKEKSKADLADLYVGRAGRQRRQMRLANLCEGCLSAKWVGWLLLQHSFRGKNCNAFMLLFWNLLLPPCSSLWPCLWELVNDLLPARAPRSQGSLWLSSALLVLPCV